MPNLNLQLLVTRADSKVADLREQIADEAAIADLADFATKG